jgi:hypothetical protein
MPAATITDRMLTYEARPRHAAIRSAWQLTDDEVAQIARTGLLELTIWGEPIPPVALAVIEPGDFTDYGWGPENEQPDPPISRTHANLAVGALYSLVSDAVQNNLHAQNLMPEAGAFLDLWHQALAMTSLAARDPQDPDGRPAENAADPRQAGSHPPARVEPIVPLVPARHGGLQLLSTGCPAKPSTSSRPNTASPATSAAAAPQNTPQKHHEPRDPPATPRTPDDGDRGRHGDRRRHPPRDPRPHHRPRPRHPRPPPRAPQLPRWLTTAHRPPTSRPNPGNASERREPRKPSPPSAPTSRLGPHPLPGPGWPDGLGKSACASQPLGDPPPAGTVRIAAWDDHQSAPARRRRTWTRSSSSARSRHAEISAAAPRGARPPGPRAPASRLQGDPAAPGAPAARPAAARSTRRPRGR